MITDAETGEFLRYSVGTGAVGKDHTDHWYILWLMSQEQIRQKPKKRRKRWHLPFNLLNPK